MLEVPLAYGYAANIIRIKNGETTKVYEFLPYGMNNFSRSWSLVWETFKKLILPVVILILSVVAIIVIAVTSLALNANAIVYILIVALIIAAYVYVISRFMLYTFADYAAIYDEKITTKEAVNKSEEIMNGNRWNLIWLNLTFIGWILLSCLTLGIGFLFLIPYMDLANIIFFEKISNYKKEKVVDEENSNDTETEKTEVYEGNVNMAESQEKKEKDNNNPIKGE